MVLLAWPACRRCSQFISLLCSFTSCSRISPESLRPLQPQLDSNKLCFSRLFRFVFFFLHFYFYFSVVGVLHLLRLREWARPNDSQSWGSGSGLGRGMGMGMGMGIRGHNKFFGHIENKWASSGPVASRGQSPDFSTV